MKVGVISTVSIDHATPASFYSHQPTRGNYYEISMELATSDYDYFAGGPPRYPMGREEDQPSAIDAAVENGFTVVNTVEDFQALTAESLPAWVLDADARGGNAMTYTLDADEKIASVADYVEKGIELLDNEDGFFMMVEGGKIDWACHANDAAAAIHDTLAFEDALAVAYGFYEQHPDETLIVVTGDHETGGMAIGFAGTRYSTFFDKIAKQTMSYEEFNEEVLAPYKESHTAEDANLEDLYGDIEAAFGLKFMPADERAALEAAADGGDEEAIAELEMVLTDLEMGVLEEAFMQSMMDEQVHSSNDYTYLLYGGYEPLTVKLTTIVNQKAGIAWTSYSHTGIPVQTSAIGVGAELFNGFYDQVDINTYIKQAAGF
jgi:alkaline phosphatase